jgi:succinate dehydrogenase/fumarate reductase flavoprotein subunit
LLEAAGDDEGAGNSRSPSPSAGFGSIDSPKCPTDGDPIPGLYAAGEIVSDIFHFSYPGGTGLTRGSVFGKIAGAGSAQ